jgi:hypothetical protein
VVALPSSAELDPAWLQGRSAVRATTGRDVRPARLGVPCDASVSRENSLGHRCCSSHAMSLFGGSATSTKRFNGVS